MIQGSFYNRTGDLVTVRIHVDSLSINLGNLSSDVYFSDDPVTISLDNDDSFNAICKRTCEINLTCKKYIPELYTALDRGVNVDVFLTNENNPENPVIWLFKGYITPMMYDLPYAQSYTTISVECQDYLCTLSNHRYKEKQIDSTGYDSVEQGSVSFKDILHDIGFSDKDEEGYIQYCWLTEEEEKHDFSKYYISNLSLLGDTEDDLEMADSLLEEICNYFNIHCMILPGEKTRLVFFSYTTKNKMKYIDYDNEAAGRDTTISFSESFHKIKLTCDVDDLEDVIRSFTNEDDLTDPCGPRVKYETEYWAWGEGKDARNAFKDMLAEKTTDYDSCSKRDYWIQIKGNKNWKFNGWGSSLVDSGTSSFHPWLVLQMSKTMQSRSGDPVSSGILMSVGKLDYDSTTDDNSPISKIDMNTYLYITVPKKKEVSMTNGWYDYNQPDKALTQSEIDLACSPYIAKFEKTIASGVLGATDDKTKNYFLFTGSIILQPDYFLESGILSERIFTGENASSFNNISYGQANCHRFDLTVNGDGCFYTEAFYDVPKNLDDPVMDSSGNFIDPFKKYTRGSRTATDFWRNNYPDAMEGLYSSYSNLKLFNDKFTFKREGYDDDVFGLCQYSDKTNKDNISKVPVLKCSMKVGEYDVIETSYNQFKWVLSSDNSTKNCLGTYEHIFTLGFNPKLGDLLFATSHKISNTVSYQLNLDDEGTAIPIPTGLSGNIDFKILSLVATVWTAEVCTRQPSTWNHSEWGDRSCEILPFVKNVIIGGFDCKVVSDDAKRTNYEEQDLVYVLSDDVEGVGTVGLKDDITFNFVTALTTDQAIAAGQNAGPKKNVVMIKKNPNKETLSPFTGFDDDPDDKPEIRYLREKYDEYNKPRLTVNGTLREFPNFFQNFRLGHSFDSEPNSRKICFPLGFEYDVKENWTKYKLKETWQDNSLGNGSNKNQGFVGGDGETVFEVDYNIDRKPFDPSDYDYKLTWTNGKTKYVNQITDKENLVRVEILGDRVSEITGQQFRDCPKLEEVIIPNSVRTIGYNAFYNCTSLLSITIPESVTRIETGAFQNCTGLLSITIPESVTSIGSYAFQNCTGLLSITIPESVTSIGSYAFQNCTGLTEITINNPNISGTGIFDNCPNIMDVYYNGTYLQWKNIENQRYDITRNYGCTVHCIDAYIKYTINGIETDYNFRYLNTYLINGEEVTKVEDSIDYTQKANLLRVQLNPRSVDNITSLTYNAFLNCTKLISVDLPYVTGIGRLLFDHCTSLQTVNLPSANTSIYNTTFRYCNNIKQLTLGVSEFNFDYIRESGSTLEDIILANCTTLKGELIHRTLDGETNNFPNLNKVYAPVCTSYPSGIEQCKELTLGVTEFIYSSSDGNQKLISIDFPNCETLGDSVFYNCSKLTTVNLPKCKTVGSGAFLSCTSLTSIDLPNCEIIKSSGFLSCTSLTSIDLPKCTSIGSSVFYYCTSLTSIDLPKCTSVSNYAFQYCSSLTSVNLPECTSIGSSAFQYCSSLTSVDIPNCETIGEYIFANCNLLEYIALPKCTIIPGHAFEHCVRLSLVYLPLVTSIGPESFESTGLTEFTIPESVTAIEYWAFKDCTGLYRLIINRINLRIADSAFSGCTIREVHYIGTGDQWYGIKNNIPISYGPIGMEANILCSDGYFIGDRWNPNYN